MSDPIPFSHEQEDSKANAEAKLEPTMGNVWAAVDDEGTTELLSRIELRYPERPHLHMTMAFKTDKAEYERTHPDTIGKQTRLKVVGIAWDEDIQAAIVDNSESGLETFKIHPHITLSHKEGVEPVRSDAMLAGPHHTEMFEQPVELPVTVEFYEFGRSKEE